MPSEKFRIATNGQSLRNPNNAFFGMTLTANLTVDESDVSAHNDRRSAHNALERQRREHLNIKFQQLAHALPSLQSVRRPSKTMIVAKSLEFVSASLKRESNYTSEIQRLRAENEKLRSQAQTQSSLLRKQVIIEEEEQEQVKETTQTEARETTLKRKACEIDSQLSPPPTPEAMRADSHKKSPVVVAAATPQKKRMVKQTKSLQSQLPASSTNVNADNMMTANSMVTPIIDSPWSPVDDHFRQPSNAYTTVADSNYINLNTSPYTTHIHSPNTNLLFMPTTTTTTTTTSTSATTQAYEPTSGTITRPQEYQNMMNSMLFAPYCLSSEPSNDFSYSFSHQRQPNDFYF